MVTGMTAKFALVFSPFLCVHWLHSTVCFLWVTQDKSEAVNSAPIVMGPSTGALSLLVVWNDPGGPKWV